MLNNYHAGNTKININACNGGIYKTYPESWFKRFHLKSSYAESVFTKDLDIIVLQMVICGDMEVIAELIYRNDFNKIIKEDGENNV